jgi:uncharacterized membrane protein
MKKLIGFFIQGIIYTVPISITFFVLYNIFDFIDRGTKSIISFIFGTDNSIISLPGLGILSLVIIITFVGYIGKFVIAKPIFEYSQTALQKLPVIKIIYSSVQDFLNAFVGKEKKFTEAVLVCLNKENSIYKLGFITSKDLSFIGMDDKMVAVYLPHSYGFTGELFITSASQISPVKAKSADILKFILSGGVSSMHLSKNLTFDKNNGGTNISG